MYKLGIMALLMVGLSFASGCSMCCSTYDEDYGAYGGVHPRGDRQHGRVGSVFDPADAYVTESSARSTEQVYYDQAP